MNGDTAVLTVGFARNGDYYNSYLNVRGDYGISASRFLGSSWNANYWLEFQRSTLSPSTIGTRAHGVGVRKVPSLIFSPEAMGWPWDLV